MGAMAVEEGGGGGDPGMAHSRSICRRMPTSPAAFKAKCPLAVSVRYLGLALFDLLLVLFIVLRRAP